MEPQVEGPHARTAQVGQVAPKETAPGKQESVSQQEPAKTPSTMTKSPRANPASGHISAAKNIPAVPVNPSIRPPGGVVYLPVRDQPSVNAQQPMPNQNDTHSKFPGIPFQISYDHTKTPLSLRGSTVFDPTTSIVVDQNDAITDSLEERRRYDYSKLTDIPAESKTLMAAMGQRYDSVVGQIQSRDLSFGADKIRQYRDWDIDSTRGPGKLALEQLHWINIQNAKLSLYTTYFKIVRNSGTTGKGPGLDDSKLQEDLSRYSKAIFEYKDFVAILNSTEPHLVDLTTVDGARLEKLSNPMGLAFEERLAVMERQMDPHLYGTAALASIIDDAKPSPLQRLLEQRKKLMISHLTWLDTREGDLAWRNRWNDLLPRHNGQGWTEADEAFEEIRAEMQLLVRKLAMAIGGGIALLSPMLIMRLHPTLLTVTLTTSVFVIVVGALLAGAMSDGTPKDVVGATAAYAAVLVVFVGVGTDFTKHSSLSSGEIARIVVGSIGGTIVCVGSIYMLWAWRNLSLLLAERTHKAAPQNLEAWKGLLGETASRLRNKRSPRFQRTIPPMRASKT